jgi:hypothetical protein
VTLAAPGLQGDNAGMAEVPGVTSLPEHACWELVRTAEVGRIAVCTTDGPDVFPLNFVVDHGTIVFRSAEGSKLSAALASTPVAFEVDGYDVSAKEAWSVVIKGKAEEVKGFYERLESLELPLFPWHASPKRHFIRIVPGVVTGRRFTIVESGAWATPTKGVRPSAPE